MSNLKKKAVISGECVACGCCVKACPLSAISVHKGMYAIADDKKCVGCGSCARCCPASVILITIKEGDAHETETLV